MTSAPASTRRWLIIRLEAPLLSFGAVAIDHRGVIWDFPGLSMWTGLFANALGWQRTDRHAHQALEDRLIFAARREREPYAGTLRDTQNAKLEKSDKGWTTRSTPADCGPPPRNSLRRRQYITPLPSLRVFGFARRLTNRVVCCGTTGLGDSLEGRNETTRC